MSRPIPDVLRRGLDNLLSNWGVLLVRLGGVLLMLVATIAALVGAIVPIAFSVGLTRLDDFKNITSPLELLTTLLVDHWLLLFALFCGFCLFLVVITAVYAFFEAGSARIYVDGERAASAFAYPARFQFEAFSAAKWLEGAKENWWAVFWIYNLIWSIAALILLVPVLVILALILVTKGNGVVVGLGCLALVVLVLLLVVVGFVAGLWTQKAIIVCVAQGVDAREALRIARAEIRADPGSHLLVAVIMIVVTMAMTGVFSGASVASAIASHGAGALLVAPMRMAASFASSLLSTAVAGWYMACYAALTVQKT